MKNIKLFEEFFYEEKPKFRDTIEWLQDIYEWSYVEQEGPNRVRFDWRNGDMSFWLNDDMTGEGELPSSIRRQVMQKINMSTK